MKYFITILCTVMLSDEREQGPPPEDSGFFSIYEYYYDIYINESMIALPNLNPDYSTVQAVYISGNLQISMRELTVFFAKFDFFRYGIRVNNTNLQTLSFLKPYMVNSLDDTSNSIEIINNPNLTTLGIDFEKCPYCTDNLVITNNPKLNLMESCDSIIKVYTANRIISGNLADCGCEIKGDFNKYVSTMSSNCWMLFGNVTIDQNSDFSVLQEKLVNVIKINGGLSVMNTQFTNLSFLSSVDLIFMDPQKTKDLASIIIKNNTNLISLEINAKRDGLYLTIRDNPNLCVSPQDLDNLFFGLSLDSELDINVCFTNQTPSHWCQLPESGLLKDLPEGCLNLTGDLVFDQNFDFENSYKLYDVESLYGSLTIVNSSLRNTNMLPNLQKIRSIKNNKNPVYVSNNSRLTSFYIHYKWSGIESGQAATIIENPNLMLYQTTCAQMRTRKAVVVKNNFENCAETESKKVIKYDRTPLNVDVYKDVPTFFDVSHGVDSPGDSGIWNNPWGQNGTDMEIPDDELEVTTPGNSGVMLIPLITVTIFTVLIL